MSLFGPIFQNGYVVTDLKAALAHWTERVGVGPFWVFPEIRFATLTYRGEAAEIPMTVAMGYSGDLQIELIQPLSDAPSVYSEFTAAGGKGLHHLGVLSESFDADLRRLPALGHQIVQSGTVGGGTGFAYFESDPAFPGSMIEVIEASPGMRRLFAKLRAAAASWDGLDPVRSL